MFLHDFTPRTNPRVIAHGPVASERRFTAVERRGAEVFRARCASCHAARLVGDDPKTEQPFSSWERLILGDNGPLVWSSEQRQKTGIEPQVHRDGARPSSLRRLDRKTPYFTNGSAATLFDVVDRARFDGARFFHDASHLDATERTQLRALDADEQAALVAFLRLL